jgi:hypothetical protein
VLATSSHAFEPSFHDPMTWRALSITPYRTLKRTNCTRHEYDSAGGHRLLLLRFLKCGHSGPSFRTSYRALFEGVFRVGLWVYNS